MSTVTVLYNISTKDWSGAEDSLTSNYCNLQIGFRSDQTEVVFDNLSFGFELKEFGETTQTENFPKGAILYRTSAEPYLAIAPLTLKPQTSYTVAMWVENAGERSTFEFSFATPDITDTGDYENSSVPHPDDDHQENYVFDETTRSWIEK